MFVKCSVDGYSTWSVTTMAQAEKDPYTDRPFEHFPVDALPKLQDWLINQFGEGPYHFAQFTAAVQALSQPGGDK